MTLIASHPDVTVNQARVSQIINKVDTGKINNLFYESHKEVDKIAEMFDIDEQTAWSIILKGKNDIERLEELTTTREGHPLKIRPWDVWNYSGCDPLFDSRFASAFRYVNIKPLIVVTCPPKRSPVIMLV